MLKKAIIISSIIFLSNNAFSAQCTNGTAKVEDDGNINLRLIGFTNSRMIQGNSSTAESSVSWAHPDNYQTPLNLKVDLDSQTILNDTSISSSKKYNYNITNISRGNHQFKVSTNSISNCAVQSSFIVQEKPSVVVPSDIVKILRASTSSDNVLLNLTASFSVDEDYSLLGSSPNYKWVVDGQEYNSQESISVNLKAGTHTAKFEVDDGTFKASGTTKITIKDELSTENVNIMTFCHSTNNTPSVLVDWAENSFSTTYEIWYQRNTTSAWSLVGQTSNEVFSYQSTEPEYTTQKIGVKSCNSNRCGPLSKRAFTNPSCNGGGYDPL